MDTFLKCTSAFEERIGLRAGFFNELIREDDWSFVIKLHAFLEACLTNAICSMLGYPELESIVARLDTSNNRSGKLAIAKQLDMLNKSQRRFVVALSELRNDLVHNARSMNFSFSKHMEVMSEEQQYQFCVALSLDEMFEPEAEPGEFRLISYVHDVPKFGIGLAAAVVASDLYLKANSGDLNNQYRLVGKRIVNSVLGASSENAP